MTDSATEPRRQARTGPLDFSETAHGMVQRIIAKADPEAAEAEASDAPVDAPHAEDGEARRIANSD